MSVTEQIVSLAQQLADERPTFFTKKGPGAGDDDTNAYMQKLREEVEKATGNDYSEKRICGDNALAVDFFVEKEETVIEIALSLRNPNCEFERDILKVLMAKEAGVQVKRLIFLAKPGGEKRVRQPSSQAMVAWAARNHRLEIIVRDLRSAAVPSQPLQPPGRDDERGMDAAPQQVIAKAERDRSSCPASRPRLS